MKFQNIIIHREVDNIAKSGNLVEICRGIKSVQAFQKDVNQITAHLLRPEEIGGNHYHEKKEEYLYFLFGEELTIYQKALNSKIQVSRTIQPGTIVYLPPKTPHAIKNTGSIDAIFLETANLSFNPDNPGNDVFPYNVI